MNTIFYFLKAGISISIVSICLIGTIPGIQAQNTLIAYYPFDGNAGDSSGNGHHGMLFGGTYASDRNGTPNGSVTLDGINDYIEFMTSPLYQPSLPVTVSAWAYIEDYNSNLLFGNCFEEDGYHGVWLNIVGGRLSAAYGDGGIIGPSWRRSKAGSTILPLSTWVHVAIVIRGATDMDLYINGRNDCGTYSGSGGPLGYGNFPGAAGVKDGLNGPGILEHYHGRIDELRFYAGILGEGEIRQQAELTPREGLTICKGDSVTLSGGLAATYSWSPSQGLSCNTCPTPKASPSSSTQYILTTTNPAGCANVDTVTVEVDSSICITDCKQVVISSRYTYTTQNQTVQFSDTAIGGSIDEIRWDFGDGNTLKTTLGTAPSHTYTAPGTYVVCMTAIDSINDTLFCQGTFCDTIAITQAQADTTCEDVNLTNSFTYLVQAFDALFTGTTTGGTVDYVNWDFGDGTTLRTLPGTQPRHTYANPGTYRVCMTSVDSVNKDLTCTSEVCQLVFISDAMSAKTGQLIQTGISYGPNPGNSQLHISSPVTPITSIQIQDLSGKVIYTQQGFIKTNMTLKTQQWPAGIFVVRLGTPIGNYFLKWSKY